MRVPGLSSLPGPGDLVALAHRAGELIEDLVAAVPRLTAVLDQTEALVGRTAELVDRIEATTLASEAVVLRIDATTSRSEEALAAVEAATARTLALVETMEPALTTLHPTLVRLAETTHATEVDALVGLVDRLPLLATQLERDVVPVMHTLGTVSPDLHDLLEVSRELNEMLAKLPGMGRIKKRVDEQQAAGELD